MTHSHDGDAPQGGSPPCFAHELHDAAAGSLPRAPEDLTAWRRAERERLIAMRMALPAESRAATAAGIARELDRLLTNETSGIVSVYWPIRGEPDLRPWMREATARGLRVALPVALALKQPLQFREWRPGARMAHGLWRIPYPAEGAEVSPTTVLAPLVGFDAQCYRLGYGGGFFDRTLAALARKPRVIGVGYEATRIATIFPQPHDIPMDWILLGEARATRRSG